MVRGMENLSYEESLRKKFSLEKAFKYIKRAYKEDGEDLLHRSVLTGQGVMVSN